MDDDVSEDAIETVEQEMPPSHAVLMAALDWLDGRATAAAGGRREAHAFRKTERALAAAVFAYEKWRRDPPSLLGKEPRC